MNEKMNKKQLTLTIVAIVTLIALVASATYAYFAVGTTNNFGTTNINATADNVGNVILNGTNANLTMNLTAVDMMKDNANTYYASSEGKTTTPTEVTIGTASVSPSTDTNYYHCTYTLNVSHTGTKDMYDWFNHKTNEEYDYTNRSTGQIILSINGTNYDFAGVWPSTIDGSFNIKAPQEVKLKAGMRFVNSNTIDQTYMAGTDISINITVTNLSCNAENEPEAPAPVISYWTYEGTNVLGSIANKVSDYRNLNVYRRFDSTANSGNGKYYVYPTASASTCESDNGGVACESIAQKYFIKETSRQITLEEPIYEVLVSQDNGETYSTYANYTATELSDFETNVLGGTTLTCDGETVTDVGMPVKCITHEAGEPYNKTSYEVCLSYGNTLICMTGNEWSDNDAMSSLKSQFEEAGLTCKYNNNSTWVGNTKPENGYLDCSDEDPENGYSAGELVWNVDSHGNAGCHVESEGGCYVGSGYAECTN